MGITDRNEPVASASNAFLFTMLSFLCLASSVVTGGEEPDSNKRGASAADMYMRG